MTIIQDERGNLIVELEQSEIKKFTKAIIEHAEDAHSTLLNFGYLLNDARYTSRSDFRQPPKAWEPGAPYPGG